jgi:dCTP deaminase
MIIPFNADKIVINGKSAGCSSASYDCRIDHDLVLGINPAFILQRSILEDWNRDDLIEALRMNPPMKALAYTVEDFHIPDNVSGDVADKSSYARVFVSAFNTLFDPGFHGNATLELINFNDEPISYQKGDPVCQMIFSWLDEPTERPYSGKYQHQTKAAHPARYEKP